MFATIKNALSTAFATAKDFILGLPTSIILIGLAIITAILASVAGIKYCLTRRGKTSEEDQTTSPEVKTEAAEFSEVKEDITNMQDEINADLDELMGESKTVPAH